MRKIIVFLIPALVLVSCTSFPDPEKYANKAIYWDENMPKEECAGLVIAKGLTVTSYNGVPVDWGNKAIVYLPPGTINLVMDASYDTGSTHFSGKNWPFQWTFNAGDRRFLYGWIRDSAPVILVIDHNDKTPWYDQPAYRVPLREGPLILE